MGKSLPDIQYHGDKIFHKMSILIVMMRMLICNQMMFRKSISLFLMLKLLLNTHF